MLTQAPEGTTVDQINYALEEVLHGKFANPYIIVTDVRAVLERFSMNLPMIGDIDGNSQEFIFEIDQEQVGNGEENKSSLYLYLIIDLDDRGHYDGFAQIVDEHELHELQNMDETEIEHEEIPVHNPVRQILAYTSNYLRQTRRTSDD
jgi:hypothetical protein